MDDFTTPPAHVGFRAKKLFGTAGTIRDGAIAHLQPGGGGPEPAHTHAHDPLSIVVSGTVRVRTGDRTITLQADEALRVPGALPHTIRNESDRTAVTVGISVDPEPSAELPDAPQCDMPM